MSEIPGSPISEHDFNIIRDAILQTRREGYEPTEIHISPRRCRFNFHAFGFRVMVSNSLAINEGRVVRVARISGAAAEPLLFDFEN